MCGWKTATSSAPGATLKAIHPGHLEPGCRQAGCDSDLGKGADTPQISCSFFFFFKETVWTVWGSGTLVTQTDATNTSLLPGVGLTLSPSPNENNLPVWWTRRVPGEKTNRG